MSERKERETRLQEIDSRLKRLNMIRPLLSDNDLIEINDLIFLLKKEKLELLKGVNG